jgi:hypothetical protein
MEEELSGAEACQGVEGGGVPQILGFWGHMGYVRAT